MNREQIYEDTYREYSSRVRGYLYNQINNREDADEVFQEVFMGFWKALETFRGDAEPSTLLGAITKNKRADFIRKKHTRLFARSDKAYLEHFSRKLGFRINVILHPAWSKHLDENQRDLVLAVKRTRESQHQQKE